MKDFLSKLIFGSRWLQAPLYLGLIVLLFIYIYEFGHDLWFLIKALPV